MQHCTECQTPIRVNGPCVHGGEWLCWNCHPAAKEHLGKSVAPRIGYRYRAGSQEYRSAFWVRPKSLAWLNTKPRKRSKEKARQAFYDAYNRDIGRGKWWQKVINRRWETA